MATKYLDYAGLGHVIEKLLARGFQSKGLSTEDFTTALKNKLNGLPSSVVDTTTYNALAAKVTSLEALIESDSDGAINKFNEIVAFLKDYAETDSLAKLLETIKTSVTNNANNISSMQSSLDSQYSTLSTAVSDITNLKTDVSGLKTRMTAVEGQASTNTSKIESLETQTSVHSTKLTQYGNAIEMLQETVAGISTISNTEIDSLITAGGKVS